MAFHRATRQQAKLRLALAGLAGSGKTYSALLVASILAELMRQQLGRRGRVGVVDTEHESASLYAMTDAQRDAYSALIGNDAIAYLSKSQAFDFDTMPLDNHSPRAYVDAIHEAEQTGIDILVLDSLSHAWSGKNGALEQKDNIAARGGNSWTAWRDITPMHNNLVDAMLACRMHLVATLRQKMEYVQNTVNGKTTIDKVGLASIQREGMEYEFTIFGDMEQGNAMRIVKHRLPGVLSIGDVFEKPGEVFTRKVHGWLMSGAAPSARPERPATAPAALSASQAIVDSLHAIETAGTLDELTALIPRLKELQGTAVYQDARRRYGERRTKLEQELVEQQRVATATARAPAVTTIESANARAAVDPAPAARKAYEDNLQPEPVMARNSPPAPAPEAA